jgi:hypothetical protein
VTIALFFNELLRAEEAMQFVLTVRIGAFDRERL